MRTYDRRFLKPFLLREKLLSRDEKLLNTFKKINELNVNKMVENPEFIFPSSTSMAQLSNMRNITLGNLLSSGLTEVGTNADLQIIGSLPSKRVDEDARYHHLLDNAMYDPKRKVLNHSNEHCLILDILYKYIQLFVSFLQQTIHKRSKLNEENTYKATKEGRLASNATFHHQNPFVLRNLIDSDQFKNRALQSQKKRSTSSNQQQHRDSSISGGSHVSRAVASQAAADSKAAANRSRATSAQRTYPLLSAFATLSTQFLYFLIFSNSPSSR